MRGDNSARGQAGKAFVGVALALSVVLLAGCSEAPSTLDPHGPRAGRVEDLWWIVFSIATAVWVAVVFIMLLAVLRKRARPSERPQSQPILFVILAGAVLPVVVLAIVLVFTLDTLKASAKPGDDSSLVVEVTGHRWWWEVHYPDSGVTTANEIHIPVNETVKVELRSADVIHSFWVPQLQGKMDLIPGRDNTLWLEASQEGTYRGQCAEFCGLQHANMAFHVVAQSRADFDAWLASETKPAERPTDPMAVEGQQVFFGSACVYCHTVRGTSASGNLGPDLTHLASREYIAAGTLENVPGNLAGWILDPQSAKPGTLMPPTQMDGPSLQALLYYLESLR